MQMIIEPKRFLHKTSSHLYVQPHPFLKKAVAHYTILQESAYTGQETLLLVPDVSGCIVFKVKKIEKYENNPVLFFIVCS